LALSDQAVVSGMSFLTTVIIGRFSTPDELGLFSFGTTVLLSTLAVQETLVTTPYMIQVHHPIGSPAEDSGAALAHSLLLSAIASILLALAALCLGGFQAEPALAMILWTLAAIMPFALLREFGRRYAFVHLRVAQVLTLDVITAAIMLSGLGWLAWSNDMSSTSAYTSLGVASGLTAILWFYLDRDGFTIRSGQVWVKLRKSWRVGRWLFAAHCALAFQGVVGYWLLAWLVSTAAPGVFAASMTLVSSSNLLVLGLGNVLGPRAVLAWKQGDAILLRQCARDSVLLAVPMIAFVGLVYFFGEDIMRLLFHGESYEGQGHAMVVLAVALLAAAVGGPAANALASMECAAEIFWTTLVASFIAIFAMWGLILKWELLGAAYGFLAGNMAGGVGRWIAVFLVIRRRR
jgi:O-antigen/teichoic acid export membrane protein